MRVLVDATAIPKDRGGVGRYLEGLLAAAAGVELVVVCQHHDAATIRGLAPWATVVPQRPSMRAPWRRLIWEQTALPRIARRRKVDVIHSPHYTLPIFSRRPRVVTMHDATFFSDPDVHRPLKRWFFRAWIRISGRLAAAIVTPSQATATELAHYVRLRGPAFVAPHGVDLTTFHVPAAEDVTRFATRHGLDRWIAFLGTLEPRKNVTALVDAHALLHAESPDTPTLALAGARGWDEALTGRLRSASDVRELGYLPIEDLPSFLGGAELVVYPSLGEGFGLPVLEAMATGAVVVTTRRLAIPEVGGDAVEYCDTDAASISTAMAGLLGSTPRRRELSAAARARAATFTWQRAWAVHREAFDEALSAR